MTHFYSEKVRVDLGMVDLASVVSGTLVVGESKDYAVNPLDVTIVEAERIRLPLADTSMANRVAAMLRHAVSICEGATNR